MLQQIQQGDTTPIEVAVPIALAIGGVQLVHEAAHLLAARVHGLRIGVPVLLPSLQIGHFGCITKLLSFPPSRTALFDFAFAGPAAAAVLSLALYVVGLVLSVDLPVPPLPAELDALVAGAIDGAANPGAASATASASASAASAAAASAASATSAAAAAAAAPAAAGPVMPLVPSNLLLSSFFLGNLGALFLPALGTSPVVSLHPLAVVGFASFLINALQCLPIGRLDGGRVTTAVLGQSSAGFVSGLTLTLLGFSTLFGGDNPILLFFGLLIIFLQRTPELPCADDISGVDDSRALAAAIAAAVVLLTLLPNPMVAQTIDGGLGF